MPSELFEKKLREKLSQATIPPSPELWNNIEAQVAGNDKRGLGFWLLLLALLLGSIGMLWGFWNYSSVNSPKQQLAEVQVESPAPVVKPLVETHSTIESSSIEKAENSTIVIPEPKSSQETKRPSPTSHPSNPSQTNPPKSTTATYSSVAKKPSVFRSKALDADLNEKLIHTVPQHANTAQPESQGLSEPSSVSLYKEIEEDNGMDLKITHLDPLADVPEILKSPFNYPMTLQSQRASKSKRWSLLAYTDFHKGYRDLNLGNSLANEDLFLAPSNSDQPAGYQYEGLNAPGNLQVVIPEESISLGILAEWKLNKRLSLQGGVEYGLFSLGTYNLNILDNSSSLPTSRFNSPLSSRNTQYRYHQFGIPLQVNYRILDRGRSSLEVYGGASVYAARAYSKSITQSANFYDFTASRGTTENAFSNTISSDVPGLIQYHPFHLTYQAGFNFSRHLSDRHAIFFGPQIKFQGSPVYKEQQREINEIPYYVGFRLGFKFSN
ncbi:MAG: hypothetical protein R8P61_08880 [Bacteroidia bacterium]|nr:hypothetical protein [Bacteroidia bacterium]